MQSNNQATTVRFDAKHEETIWGIAFWVKKNIDESRFSCANHELPRLTDEILAENSSDARLERLLEAIGGDSEDHAAAMFHAVVYVSRGYCKYSSVYPKQWLDVYRKWVSEMHASGAGELLENEFLRIAAHRLVAAK